MATDGEFDPCIAYNLTKRSLGQWSYFALSYPLENSQFAIEPFGHGKRWLFHSKFPFSMVLCRFTRGIQPTDSWDSSQTAPLGPSDGSSTWPTHGNWHRNPKLVAFSWLKMVKNPKLFLYWTMNGIIVKCVFPCVGHLEMASAVFSSDVMGFFQLPQTFKKTLGKDPSSGKPTKKLMGKIHHFSTGP